MEREIFQGSRGHKNNEIHRLDRLSLATDGIFIVDLDKKITSFSEKVERITGYSFQEIAGKGCWEVFNADLCQKGCLVDDTLITGNVYTSICVTIKKKDNSPSMISTTITPLKDIKGRIVGAIVTFKDMAELDYFLKEIEKKEEEVTLERDRFHALIEHLNEGVFSVDRSWKITTFNGTAEQLAGYSRKEVIGRECRSVFRSEHCGADCILEKALYLGEALSGVQIEILDKEGRRKPVLVTSVPFYDQKGEFVGGVETFRDLSMEGPSISVPLELKGAEPKGPVIEAFERQLIINRLEECRWNRGLAAKKLGISSVTLWRKMKKYGIHR